jgi:hypothetical protein
MAEPAYPCQETRDRRGMNIERLSSIRGGLLALRDHLHHLCLLLGRQLCTPSNATFVAGGFKTSLCSLSLHGSLEFCKRSDHLHHHSPGWRRDVDRLCETAKASLRFLNPLHNREPSRRDRDSRSSFQTTRTSPLRRLSRSRCNSGRDLRRRVLFVGRNACVADEHSCGKVSPITLSSQYLFATRIAGL